MNFILSLKWRTELQGKDINRQHWKEWFKSYSSKIVRGVTIQHLGRMRGLFDCLWKFLSVVQIRLMERATWLLYPASFASASTVCTIRQSSAHLQWHHLLHICHQQQQISFSAPSVTQIHSHSVLSLINQPGNTHMFVWPSQREFIIQLLTKSGTPRAVLATAGEVTHTVDLLAWYTGQSKIKYVPRDISHSSWNCHKPIFTARTSRNWKSENTVASWPSKQSHALKALPHSRIQKYLERNMLGEKITFSLNLLSVKISWQKRCSWSKGQTDPLADWSTKGIMCSTATPQFSYAFGCFQVSLRQVNGSITGSECLFCWKMSHGVLLWCSFSVQRAGQRAQANAGNRKQISLSIWNLNGCPIKQTDGTALCTCRKQLILIRSQPWWILFGPVSAAQRWRVREKNLKRCSWTLWLLLTFRAFISPVTQEIQYYHYSGSKKSLLTLPWYRAQNRDDWERGHFTLCQAIRSDLSIHFN